ncbi:MAG: hypothetical protein KA791_13090 [Flavobacteriales bacterium]|nr:hypothetical protein [Flavobacteriales bacterium]
MRYLIAGTVLACASLEGDAATTTPLIELLEQGRIELTPRGLGGHSGECLKVDVKSRTATSIRTSIPAGWVFVSQEEGVQDLIVVREEAIALVPNGRTTVTCRAFCCEASNGGPGENEPYRKGHPAPKKLTTLARFVDSLGYDDGIVQSAIWVLSDGHDIASLGALDSSANDTLRNKLSALSGQPAPRYSVRYAEDERMACSGRPESISRIVSVVRVVPDRLTIVVRSDAGRLIDVIQDRMPIEAGRAQVPVELNVLDWPKGRYAIYAWTEGGADVQRLPFTL